MRYPFTGWRQGVSLPARSQLRRVAGEVPRKAAASLTVRYPLSCLGMCPRPTLISLARDWVSWCRIAGRWSEIKESAAAPYGMGEARAREAPWRLADRYDVMPPVVIDVPGCFRSGFWM